MGELSVRRRLPAHSNLRSAQQLLNRNQHQQEGRAGGRTQRPAVGPEQQTRRSPVSLPIAQRGWVA